MKFVLAFALVVAFSVVVLADQQPPATGSHHDVLQQLPVPSDSARRPVPLTGDQNGHPSQDDEGENMEGAESRHYHKKGGHKGGKKWGRK